MFNPPATYWDGLSMIIKYIGKKEGGLDKLKGKKIGFLHLDAGFGKEPIPLLEQLAKDSASRWRSIRSPPRTCRTSPRNGSASAATGPTTWSCGAGAP